MADGPHITFGRNIRKHREAKGLSATEAAREMKVARTALSRWENGHELPRGKSMFKLRNHLGMPLETNEDIQLSTQLELPFDRPTTLELKVTRKTQDVVQLELRLRTQAN